MLPLLFFLLSITYVGSEEMERRGMPMGLIPMRMGGPRGGGMRMSSGPVPLERIFADILPMMMMGGMPRMGGGELGGFRPPPGMLGEEEATFKMTTFERDPDTGKLIRVTERTQTGDKVEENVEELDREHHRIHRRTSHRKGQQKHDLEVDEDIESHEMLGGDENIENLEADEVFKFEEGFDNAGLGINRRTGKSRLADFEDGEDPLFHMLNNMGGGLFGGGRGGLFGGPMRINLRGREREGEESRSGASESGESDIVTGSRGQRGASVRPDRENFETGNRGASASEIGNDPYFENEEEIPE